MRVNRKLDIIIRDNEMFLGLDFGFCIMYEEEKMEKEWENAVMLLCSIMESRVGTLEDILVYLEFMKDAYGLKAEEFLEIYNQWCESGEFSEAFGEKSIQENDIWIFRKVVDGLCRMILEGQLDEECAEEILWEESYKTADFYSEEMRKMVGFYPQFPGCIGYADSKETLDVVMRSALKKWFHSAYLFWKEKQFINEL